MTVRKGNGYVWGIEEERLRDALWHAEPDEDPPPASMREPMYQGRAK